MSELAEAIAYIVGAVAAVIIFGMMLVFFAWLIAIAVGVLCIAALVFGILRLCGVDVKAKVDELF